MLYYVVQRAIAEKDRKLVWVDWHEFRGRSYCAILAQLSAYYRNRRVLDNLRVRAGRADSHGFIPCTDLSKVSG